MFPAFASSPALPVYESLSPLSVSPPTMFTNEVKLVAPSPVYESLSPLSVSPPPMFTDEVNHGLPGSSPLSRLRFVPSYRAWIWHKRRTCSPSPHVRPWIQANESRRLNQSPGRESVESKRRDPKQVFETVPSRPRGSLGKAHLKDSSRHGHANVSSGSDEAKRHLR